MILKYIKIKFKHLPGQHDQQDHDPNKTILSDEEMSEYLDKRLGRRATRREPEPKPKPTREESSLSKHLVGKTVGKSTIKGVYIDKKLSKDERMVVYEDGSESAMPVPVLQKLAGVKPGKPAPFRSLGAARKAGFTSLAQASYLLAEKPEVYKQIMDEAQAGTRYWDEESGKMVIPKKSKKEVSDKQQLPDYNIENDTEGLDQLFEMLEKYNIEDVIDAVRR